MPPAARVEIPVEICPAALLFRNLHKTCGCMMIFQQASQSRCRRAFGLVSTVIFFGVVRAFKDQGEK